MLIFTGLPLYRRMFVFSVLFCCLTLASLRFYCPTVQVSHFPILLGKALPGIYTLARVQLFSSQVICLCDMDLLEVTQMTSQEKQCPHTAWAQWNCVEVSMLPPSELSNNCFQIQHFFDFPILRPEWFLLMVFSDHLSAPHWKGCTALLFKYILNSEFASHLGLWVLRILSHLLEEWHFPSMLFLSATNVEHPLCPPQPNFVRGFNYPCGCFCIPVPG